MATDSPAFTDADANAFRRLLSNPRRPYPAANVTVLGPRTPDPATPDPPTDGGDGHGDGCRHTMVAVTVLRGDRQVSASAILHEPLEEGELHRAARACVAGAIAQLADYDTDDAGPRR